MRSLSATINVAQRDAGDGLASLVSGDLSSEDVQLLKYCRVVLDAFARSSEYIMLTPWPYPIHGLARYVTDVTEHLI